MGDGPVVIVGDARSWPSGYRGLSTHLSEVSGRQVHVVPLAPPDWFLARLRGYGQLVFEVASTVDRALLETHDDRAVIVGHSEGGILARLYVGGERPFGGRRHSGHRRISHLITLGTPHNVREGGGILALVRETNELFPGALHKPGGLRYLSVAGAAVEGAASAGARRRYRRFGGDALVKGDGVVPVASALLPDSEHLVLDDLRHSRLRAGYGGRWYGSDRETVERWWPEDLRAGR